MTTFRRRADGAYGLAAASGSYVAIVESEAGYIAARYERGAYVADLAETGALSTIQVAASATLAQGRYLIVPHEETIEVWDLVANDVLTYSPSGGRFIVGAAALGGAIYWVEVESYDWIAAGPGWQSTLYLRSSTLELGSPATVATVVVGDSFHWEWSPLPGWFAVNPTAALVELRADDAVNHEVLTYFRARLELDGLFSEFAQVEPAEVEIGVPEALGGALALPVGSESLVRLLDDVDADPVTHWPASGEWLIWGTCLSTTEDLSEVGVFGSDGADPIFIRAAVEAIEGSPLDRFVVGDHPEGSPVLFFVGG